MTMLLRNLSFVSNQITVTKLYCRCLEIARNIQRLKSNEVVYRMNPIVEHLKRNPEYWKDHSEGLKRLTEKLEDETNLTLKSGYEEALESILSRLKLIEDDVEFLRKTGVNVELNEYIVRECPRMSQEIRYSLLDIFGYPMDEYVDVVEANGYLVSFDVRSKILTIATRVGRIIVIQE